ncbi:chemotaxis protein MotB [Kiloniella laminariae]|uniref:Chemotaxis protein MotB n=1 Tax=Kiloniella laminariae TaxID=454162 RepID=A0ABT4LHB7_9PROT|nr:flagellar motor protein MotB [Kiloniella laminariae]MCZ4280484.1 chemotaxis protein MotB [Kiloniella laminariae]
MSEKKDPQFTYRAPGKDKGPAKKASARKSTKKSTGKTADELYAESEVDEDVAVRTVKVAVPAVAQEYYLTRLLRTTEKQHDAQGPVFSSSWMVTFTDLVALMLTFFVLLYSMSVMEEKKWRNLVDSLSTSLKVERFVVEPKPAKSLTMEPVDFIPGEDLDYLYSLLGQKLKDDPELSSALLTRLEDRLVVSLPGDLLFEPGDITPLAKTEAALIRLGRVMGFIDNRIEIAGHADPSVPGNSSAYPSNWELSLARSDYVAVLLEKSGYKNTILSRGYGDSRYGKLSDKLSATQKDKLARRVDIIIHLYAGENG